ncbi:Phage-like element PBSX protein XkdG precursor [compost metagenome]
MPNAYGIPVRGIAMLQGYDADGAGAGTDIVNDGFLVHPKNILVGISRNIRVEFDRDIRERKFIIVLTAKIDTQFEEEDAVAKAIKIQNQVS